MSGGHGHVDASHKGIGLLISILALVLAFSETLGKSAQTTALNQNIEASNLWAFFQAKSIRLTTMRTAAESFEATLPAQTNAAAKDAMTKRAAAWKETAARYDSEPETQEGRKELAARAKTAEAKRDRSLAAYHHFELASAAVQIAIVLAGASIITAVAALAWIAGGLGVVGVIFCGIGFFMPQAVHLF